MATIQFEDGTQVEVQGNPIPADVDYIHSQIQASKQPTPQPLQQAPVPSTFGSRYGEQISQGANKIGSSILGGAETMRQGYEQGGLSGVGTFLKGVTQAGAGAVVGAGQSIFAPVTAGVQPLVSSVVNNLKKGSEPLNKYDTTQQTRNNIIQGISNIAKENPVTADVVQASLLGLGGGKGDILNQGVGETAIALKNTAVDTAQSLKQTLAKSPESLQADILSNYQKGIKPSIAGQNTVGAIEKSNNNILNAVDTIKQNAPNLKFTNDLGEEVVGQTPRTVQQLQDAVEQTKSKIFEQYDNLAKQAGEAGVGVDLKPIATQLDSVINDKALQLTNPSAIEYAKLMKDRFNTTGSLDASTAQRVIQNYNESLKAFYRNPSYETASKAGIDAMVANNMRKALDEGITGLTGTQYQTLKNQYGALSSIEKDVVKAGLRQARANSKSLIDFTDIFTGNDLAHGILSMNPATITSSLGARALKEFYKHLNSPDTAVTKLFKASNKLPEGSIQLKPSIKK